jgi:molybdopterin synthase catalytic subunit
MQVEIEITAQPTAARFEPPEEIRGRAGAQAEFTGLVRGEEAGRAIAALEYEAYQPMAERVIRAIVEDINLRHPCDWVRVTHRVGVIPVGEAAICVVAAARHRPEAFAMLTEFMDRLKQDVPIWKRRALSPDEFRALTKL